MGEVIGFLVVYTSLYKKGIKENQNRPMETTALYILSSIYKLTKNKVRTLSQDLYFLSFKNVTRSFCNSILEPFGPSEMTLCPKANPSFPNCILYLLAAPFCLVTVMYMSIVLSGHRDVYVYCIH